MVLETLAFSSLNHLTRPVAREDFIMMYGLPARDAVFAVTNVQFPVTLGVAIIYTSSDNRLFLHTYP
jgi:hypothetical protein